MRHILRWQFLAIGLIVSILVFAWPQKLSELRYSVRAFAPLVAVTVTPQDILFADPFTLEIRVTVDTRVFRPDSARFVIPSENFVVQGEQVTRAGTDPVITVTKTFLLQCLDCLPSGKPYKFAVPAVILTKRDGTLASVTDSSFAVRVHPRVMPQDLIDPINALRPQRPSVSPWHPGMHLVPYLLAGGIATFVAGGWCTWRLARRRLAVIPVPETPQAPYATQRSALEALLEALDTGAATLSDILADAYIILRGLSEHDETLDRRFVEAVFGSPQNLTHDAARALLRDLIQFIERLAEVSDGPR